MKQQQSFAQIVGIRQLSVLERDKGSDNRKLWTTIPPLINYLDIIGGAAREKTAAVLLLEPLDTSCLALASGRNETRAANA